jgi:hypothetical protein
VGNLQEQVLAEGFLNSFLGFIAAGSPAIA